jgi:hypothetical protein
MWKCTSLAAASIEVAAQQQQSRVRMATRLDTVKLLAFILLIGSFHYA